MQRLALVLLGIALLGLPGAASATTLVVANVTGNYAYHPAPGANCYDGGCPTLGGPQIDLGNVFPIFPIGDFGLLDDRANLEVIVHSTVPLTALDLFIPVHAVFFKRDAMGDPVDITSGPPLSENILMGPPGTNTHDYIVIFGVLYGWSDDGHGDFSQGEPVGPVSLNLPAPDSGTYSIEAISGVPEPLTWLLLIVGFGAIGARCKQMRGRTEDWTHVRCRPQYRWVFGFQGAACAGC
jgi:hypothetical protein